MATLSADQARALARSFHDLAVEVARRRFDNWNDLTQGQRDELESREWTLLTNASDMTTHAMNLGVDGVQDALAEIRTATDALQAAVRHAKDAKKVIAYAAAAVMLGAAIISGHPTAITGAVSGAVSATKGA